MEKINILIPMAGEGSRFKKSGFKNIKISENVNFEKLYKMRKVQ